MLTASDLEKICKKFGPYFYHFTKGERAYWIDQEGLRPYSELPISLRAEQDVVDPRPGHVYFGSPLVMAGYISSFVHESKMFEPDELFWQAAVYRLDIRTIDPKTIGPDEDAFWTNMTGEGMHEYDNLIAEDYGLDDPNEAIEDEEYRSYGKWAQANRLGDKNSKLTQKAIKTTQTLTVKGSLNSDQFTKITLREAHAFVLAHRHVKKVFEERDAVEDYAALFQHLDSGLQPALA